MAAKTPSTSSIEQSATTNYELTVTVRVGSISDKSLPEAAKAVLESESIVETIDITELADLTPKGGCTYITVKANAELSAMLTPTEVTTELETTTAIESVTET